MPATTARVAPISAASTKKKPRYATGWEVAISHLCANQREIETVEEEVEAAEAEEKTVHEPKPKHPEKEGSPVIYVKQQQHKRKMTIVVITTTT